VRIAIVTDAWRPQTNGVVHTLSTTAERLTALDHEVTLIEPNQFRTVPCPTYPEIRLALFPYAKVHTMLAACAPDAVHIATEGPLGMAARRWCSRERMPFTTSYHTQFPEYVRARAPIPLSWSYAHMRRFHSTAARTMVATPTMQRHLESRGFRNLVRWTRGVNVELFKPAPKSFLDLPRPIFMNVGRVAVEKNIDAFLELDLPGTKVIVGDGPERGRLQSQYPAAVFTGFKYGAELAAYVAAADVFVFPSLTDTFGLVLLEAMSCAVPVAAFPVTGPIDIVQNGVTGVLNQDLRVAALVALELDPAACRSYALQHTWDAATQQFLGNLAPRGEVSAAPAAPPRAPARSSRERAATPQ
jgi:glycosyltransferase involved in cell wall biosynthesis